MRAVFWSVGFLPSRGATRALSTLVRATSRSSAFNSCTPPFASIFPRGVRTVAGAVLPVGPGGMAAVGPANVDECFKFSTAVKTVVSSYLFTSQLVALKMSAGGLSDKWDKMMMLLLMARIQAAKESFGLSEQDALQKAGIIQHYIATNRTNPQWAATVQSEKEILEIILKMALEKSVPESLELAKVRKIAFRLTSMIYNDEFLDGLRQLRKLDLMAKNAKITPILHNIQVAAFENEGLKGDDGFIAAQKSLMEFASDPFVQAQVNSYMVLVVEAAEVPLMGR